MNLVNIPAYRYILLVQAALTLCCLLGSYIIGDTLAAFWSLIAGMLLIISNTFFSIKVFQYRGATQLHRIFASAVVGWMGRFIILMAGFVVVFLYIGKQDAIYFVTTLGVVGFSHLIVLIVCRKHL